MTFAWTSLLASITLIGSSMSWTTLVFEPEERIISKNTLVTTIPVLGKEWRVTFEVMMSIKYDLNHMLYHQVKPAHYTEAQYQNVLHLTIGGSHEQNGDRTPAVWIHPDKGVLFSSAVNGKSDYGFFCPKHLPQAGIWTLYEVSQVCKEEEHFFVISINGEEVHSTMNKRPEVFTNVGVFASNPWDANPHRPASLRNLKIESEVSGT